MRKGRRAAFWLIKVKKAEAIARVKRSSNQHNTETEIEMRRVCEAEDCAPEFIPALRRQGERQRAI
jgi:hypothetical protein